MDSAGCIYIYICANITKEGGFLLKTNANCSPASKKKIKSVNILAWRGRGLWVPIPNWRALDCWWLERRNNTLSLGMWILVGWPCSCECFHTHAYMGKKKNQNCYFKKGYGRGQYEWDGFRGRTGEWLWSKYIRVYMHEILKNNKIIFKNITILTLKWHSRILTVLQQYYKSLLHINHIKLLE